MGLDLTVRYPDDETPTWDAIRSHVARTGTAISLRMIDGMPAFRDESPEAGWSELRLGCPSGMVTLRRTPSRITCVVWGNADAGLLADRDRVCWACACAGDGVVETESGSIAADEFARLVGISH